MNHLRYHGLEIDQALDELILAGIPVEQRTALSIKRVHTAQKKRLRITKRQAMEAEKAQEKIRRHQWTRFCSLWKTVGVAMARGQYDEPGQIPAASEIEWWPDGIKARWKARRVRVGPVLGLWRCEGHATDFHHGIAAWGALMSLCAADPRIICRNYDEERRGYDESRLHWIAIVVDQFARRHEICSHVAAAVAAHIWLMGIPQPQAQEAA